MSQSSNPDPPLTAMAARQAADARCTPSELHAATRLTGSVGAPCAWAAAGSGDGDGECKGHGTDERDGGDGATMVYHPRQTSWVGGVACRLVRHRPA